MIRYPEMALVPFDVGSFQLSVVGASLEIFTARLVGAAGAGTGSIGPAADDARLVPELFVEVAVQVYLAPAVRPVMVAIVVVVVRVAVVGPVQVTLLLVMGEPFAFPSSKETVMVPREGAVRIRFLGAAGAEGVTRVSIPV